ncbi:4-alpha-glucanotransferase [Catalinimonas alkaloidigena]|uniref:4-alpha-glucanotransferase n=1 Tax=Catalinimonas alkaloidigena TaxID=1075417 RepID=A0A1G9F6Y9_9BACT|nr:4-alpha-glucanotransferase [Catalinimonas alkaloidigena]SDK84146.1 4-alpha-glucanotransferase [Catalinimonas alkaloidigena]
MNIERSSGILLHITSLPSAYGIGDLGPAAYEFVDFLVDAGQSWWQLLPLNPTEMGSGNSPYSGLSAFAGNPLLISPEVLIEEGYLQKSDLSKTPSFPTDKTDFEKVIPFRVQLLEKAYRAFRERGTTKQQKAFRKFCKAQKFWLDDFALYMALRQYFNGTSWSEWPEPIRLRKKKALKEISQEVADTIEREQFLQYEFFRQWFALKSYCQRREVGLFGDIPFYVGYDSADVWANQHIFNLDSDGKSKTVSGVPPDYFSKTGQRWGTPVFRWDVLKDENYGWWVDRIDQNLAMFDLIRLDHFRAFSAFWEVPADEETAINGQWSPGPGKSFFKLLKKHYPSLPIVAEDLGDIDAPVRKLMHKFDLPGMRVLQFAFGDGMPKGIYIPHHHDVNAIVYTGTHDNNTTRGWYDNMSTPEDRKRLQAYAGQRVTKVNVHDVVLRLAMSSVAQLAVFPMQDALGLGEEAIMNRPSVAQGNWAWRLEPNKLTPELAHHLRELTLLYDRLPEKAMVAEDDEDA